MYLDVTDTTLYYEKFGCDNPPLLLLHGNGETHEIFNELIPLLTDRYTVYAIDSREHGLSKKTLSGELHYEDMARDIADFIKILHLEKPTIYGFSDGAIIALIMGYTWPELCRRLIISGANANPRGLKKNILRKMQLQYIFHSNPKLALMVKEPHILRRDLKRIKVPVMVLAGEYDMVRTEHTEAIAQAIPHSQLEILFGENHSSYVVHNTKIMKYL